MLLIGENINIMGTKIKQAIKERNKQPIQEIAKISRENGVDYLDVNIGPARKDGPHLMEWAIKTIREVVDLPLSLDTTNIEAIKVGLELEGEKCLINSIQATPERMEQLLPLVKKFNCKCIALLIGKEGMPRDATERSALACEFSIRVDELGIPHKNIYFDPIVLPVRFQQDQVVATLEFMKMFKEMFFDYCSTCGLSNVSNGVPENLRGLVNRTYLLMLMKYGLESAIIDAFDTELIQMVRGEKEEIKRIVWHTLDENINAQELSQEQMDYYKTTCVLAGKSIYSDSWLKL
ncbi:MAG: dihydropteroate synthase [Candidatus Omnitrophica bacterium]|nr:dihydropteroate synthase [Candidatus Omnitrophota bacterium]MCM8828844.1 dihydropteroate synthase [Candidatus Omnitrophota bacterium]